MGDKCKVSPDTSIADDNGAEVIRPDPQESEDELDNSVVLCSPCFEEDSVRVKSEVFCLECRDFLCVSCRKQHRLSRPTRSHHLLEKDNTDDEITESCPEHPGRDIDHFCEDHLALVCRACINVSHPACQKIKRIQVEAKDVKSSKELTQGMDNLNNLITSFSGYKDDRTKQMQRSKDQKEVCKGRIKELRRKAADFFDRLEASAERDLNDVVSAIIQSTAGEEETFQSAIEALLNTKANLEQITKTASDAQIFITLKRTLQQVRKYSDFQAETERSMNDIDIDFKEDERFKRIFSVTSALGRVEAHSDLTHPAKIPQIPPGPVRPIKAVPAGGHAVRIPGDRTTCYITGCVYMDDGRIVLADHNNRVLKMFNVDFKLLSCQTVDSRPNDIAVVTQNEIVTSLMDDEHKLQFLKLTMEIKADRQIRTEVQYSGLACSREPLLFACCSVKEGTGNIHVLDMLGNVLNQITQTPACETIFVRPCSLAISQDGKLLFINDLGQNAVICIDITLLPNCRLMFVYKDRTLELRNGIALDETGSIYVASGNRSIHQVSYTGTKVHEILTEKGGIGQPHALCLSPRKNNLLVAEFKENCVKVFNLI